MPNPRGSGSSSNDTTKPVGATLTWEQYCSQVGVDAKAARDASTVRALAALIRRLDAAMDRRCNAEPSAPTCDPVG